MRSLAIAVLSIHLVLSVGWLRAEPLPPDTRLATAPATTGPVGLKDPELPASVGNNDPQHNLEYFFDHVRPMEPIYFLGFGTKDPGAKFQFSLKFRVLSSSASASDWLNNFYLGYTQTSLWDLGKPSAPFLDTTFKPELMYDQLFKEPARPRFLSFAALQMGLQHESNGKEGADSRSIPLQPYIQPTLRLGTSEDANLLIQPRARMYVGRLSENESMATYRGYGDLRVVLNLPKGIALSATGRLGTDWHHGAGQFDLTVPIRSVPVLGRDLPFFVRFDPFFQVQYFTGFGESMLRFDEHTDVIRFGIGFIR